MASERVRLTIGEAMVAVGATLGIDHTTLSGFVVIGFDEENDSFIAHNLATRGDVVLLMLTEASKLVNEYDLHEIVND